MFQVNQLKPTFVTKGYLNLNGSYIFHVIPDFNTKLLDYINSDNFIIQKKQIDLVLIRSGSSAGSPNQKSTVGIAKQYLSEFKSVFPRVSFIRPNNISQKKALLIDYSTVLLSYDHIQNPRKKLDLILEVIKNNFIDFKRQYRTEQNIIFQFNNTSELLEQLLEYSKINRSDTSRFAFFDNYIIGSLQKHSILLANYENGSIKLHLPAFNILASNYSEPEVIPDNNTSDIILPINQVKLASKLEKYSEKEISSDQLHNIFKQYEINNPVIENVIKSSLELIDTKKLSKEELEKTVFINLYEYLHGKDRPIPANILNNPEILFKQINSFNEHQKEIKFNPVNASFIDPNNDFISINAITGPSRHKFEFSENIHTHIKKLFKTLEEKNFPIDILDIKYDIKDNNIDRYIDYTITLKNKSGGIKEPYEIKLKVPHLVNERYFKLNGKEYILSSQQFLVPLTKNNPDEARFLSHYNIITQKLVNFKYSPSNLNEIIKYISRTYSKSIKSFDNTTGKIVFKNGMEVDLHNNHIPFRNKTVELRHESGNYFVYKDGIKIDSPVKRTEYIFEHLYDFISSVNPTDNLKRSMRSLQYVEIHVMGPKMPLILALWQQLGLTEALVKLGIDFKLVDSLDEYEFKPKEQSYQLADGYLIVSPSTKREEYIINGLLKLDFLKGISQADISKRESSYPYLVDTYGTKILNNLDGMVENAIDPITKELLEFYQLPTNIIDIMTGPLLDKLFNDPVDHPSDLSSLRVRLSEYMSQLLYNEINRCLT